jgi:hypothetical protein
MERIELSKEITRLRREDQYLKFNRFRQLNSAKWNESKKCYTVQILKLNYKVGFCKL